MNQQGVWGVILGIAHKRILEVHVEVDKVRCMRDQCLDHSLKDPTTLVNPISMCNIVLKSWTIEGWVRVFHKENSGRMARLPTFNGVW